MSIYRFEDIIAWQKAKVLTSKLYTLLRECKDFGFANQNQHTSALVMNNIALGFKLNEEEKFNHYIFKAKYVQC